MLTFNIVYSTHIHDDQNDGDKKCTAACGNDDSYVVMNNMFWECLCVTVFTLCASNLSTITPHPKVVKILVRPD